MASLDSFGTGEDTVRNTPGSTPTESSDREPSNIEKQLDQVQKRMASTSGQIKWLLESGRLAGIDTQIREKIERPVSNLVELARLSSAEAEKVLAEFSGFKERQRKVFAVSEVSTTELQKLELVTHVSTKVLDILAMDPAITNPVSPVDVV